MVLSQYADDPYVIVLADKLTEENKGKHHIGDFLPPEELEKFVERVKAARGETVAGECSHKCALH